MADAVPKPLDREPPDHELRGFALQLLGKFGSLFAEEGLLEEAIHEHRDLWVMLYHTDRGGIDFANPS
jgi:hypothetical protein